MRQYVWVVAIVLLSANWSTSQTPETSTDLKTLMKSLDFSELKGRAQRQDSTLDFSHLRFAFAKTRQYDPYGKKLDKNIADMQQAFSFGEYKESLKNARKILDKNFTDIRAHIIATIAFDNLGQPDSAFFHRWMWTGLLKSITTYGDGKSPQTAYIVISVDEEYQLLESLEYRLLSQGLGSDSTGAWDCMKVVRTADSRDTLELYFNINLPWAKMRRSF